MLGRIGQLFVTEMMQSHGHSRRAGAARPGECHRFCSSGLGTAVRGFCCSGRTTDRLAGASG